MKKLFIVILILIIHDVFDARIFASPFQCERFFSPSLQVDQIKFCNSRHDSRFFNINTMSRADYDNWIYHSMLPANNVGGIKVLLPNGKTKIVYRSAYLVGAPLCIHALSMHGVRTVINLYSGNYAYARELDPLEKAIFKENGVPIYIHDHNFNVMHVVSFKKKDQNSLNREVVRIIGKITTAQGNVLVHCYVGEHESAIIFGVLNKCFNHQSMKSINQNNYCHSPHNSKFFDAAYQNVLQIVDQFPCSSLQNKDAVYSAASRQSH